MHESFYPGINPNTIFPQVEEGGLLGSGFDALIEQAGFDNYLANSLPANVKEVIADTVGNVLSFDDLETETAIHSADARIARKTGFGKSDCDIGLLRTRLTLLKMFLGETVCKVQLAKAGEFTLPYKSIKPDLAKRMFENCSTKHGGYEKFEDAQVTLGAEVIKSLVEQLLKN